MAAAATVAFCGCNKDIAISEINGDIQADVFTATIEEGTRTTLGAGDDDRKVFWESGDVISVNGVSYQSNSAGLSSTFAKQGSEPATLVDGKYKAYFPASLYSEGLPSTYVFQEGGFNMPMYAESTSNTLAFKNICAVLAITVTSSDMSTVRKIKVTSDQVMWGPFTVTDNAAVLSADGDEYKTVMLDCGSDGTATTAAGTTFYIPVPAQTYSYFSIYLSADGTTYKEVMATKKASGLGAIERNKIFSIDYNKNAVQLWADGPYWSTTNIGAATETAYGHYFAWGYAEGCVRKEKGWVLADDNTTAKRFDLDYFPKKFSSNFADAATANWGMVWKMPTADNFRDLINNSKTVVSFSSGVRISGKNEGYTTYSIFLPASGYTYYDTYYSSNDRAHYWSTTEGTTMNSQNELYRAYYLGFRIDNVPAKSSIEVHVDDKYIGQSIRPILK